MDVAPECDINLVPSRDNDNTNTNNKNNKDCERTRALHTHTICIRVSECVAQTVTIRTKNARTTTTNSLQHERLEVAQVVLRRDRVGTVHLAVPEHKHPGRRGAVDGSEVRVDERELARSVG